MNYFDIINHAIELVVLDAGNGSWFLEPRYREALRSAGLFDNGIIPEEELFEIVRLEVEKRNALNDQSKVVAAWIADMLMSAIDPAVTEQENELMKNMLAYLERDKEAKKKEAQEAEMKEKVGNVLPFGVNLAKRKAEST